MTEPSDNRFAEQYAKAQHLQQQGQFAPARAIYEEILGAQPDHLDALSAMGVLAGQTKDLHEAIGYFDRAIAVAPGNAGAHCNRGLALKQLNQPDAALACFDRAIALDPANVIAYYSRAETYKDLRLADDALASYDQALAINPNFIHASYRRGVVLQQIGRLPEAIASYDQVLQIKPDHFDSHANRAFLLFGLGRNDEAFAACDRAISLKPDQASLYVLRGNLLRALGRLEAALTSYEHAIDIDPESAEAHGNRGTVLLLLNKVAAMASFDRAIEIDPGYAEAYFNRAHSRNRLREYKAAVADYKTVDALAPEFEFLPGAHLESSLRICDWSDFDALVERAATGIQKGGRVCEPFVFLGICDSAGPQHNAARIWVDHVAPRNDALGNIPRRTRPRKLTVGYFSCDFHEHPVGRLLVELIELHDRSRFEVVAFSFGAQTGDPVQQRLTRAFDRFFDLSDKSNLEIAALARRIDIDIAVDLGGYTRGNRAGIFALRAAPIQINYLGYPGTMGAEFMDYLIADGTVVPRARQGDYAEKIIYLPESFMPFDSSYAISEKVFTREELGLPPRGFVFCCFNNSFKLTPVMFDRWMSILARTEGAVLWLSRANAEAAANLRAEASRRGIDERRLIFAERMDSLPEHLSRLRAADLFLDTFPYNAHATAVDALWAGLPVLTYAGEGFASRVAASLLRSMGLPELIAGSLSEYEERAVNLAADPSGLGQLRRQLALKRTTARLFDTTRYTRNLEAAYRAVHDRHQEGLPPDHVELCIE